MLTLKEDTKDLCHAVGFVGYLVLGGAFIIVRMPATTAAQLAVYLVKSMVRSV